MSGQLTPEEIVSALKGEIQTGDINSYYQTELGIEPEMAAILTAATLARAITYGYAIPTVIETFISAWRNYHGSAIL